MLVLVLLEHIMGNTDIARREHVVNVWGAVCEKFPHAPVGPKCIRTVARQCKERSRFVLKWVNRWLSDQTSSAFAGRHSSGRPRKVAYPDVAELVHDPLSKSSFRAGAARSKSRLGVSVSRSTISRAVHKMGWHKYKVAKGGKLNSNKIEMRKQWAREHANYPWVTTVMADSTIITYCPPRTSDYGQWAPPGEHVDQQETGSQLHIYAGASPSGLSALHECTGSTGVHLPYTYSCGRRKGQLRTGVGGDEAKDVLSAIIAESTACFPESLRPHIKMKLDRATPHISSPVRKLMRDYHFRDNLLPAPGCDINWMDWAIWPRLKQCVYNRKADYDDFQQFRLVVHEEWMKMRDRRRWGWLAARQTKRLAEIAKHGKLLH